MVNLVLSQYSWAELSGPFESARNIPLAIASLVAADGSESAEDAAEEVRRIVRPEMGYSTVLIPSMECLPQCIVKGTQAGAVQAAGLLVDFSGEIEGIEDDSLRGLVSSSYERIICTSVTAFAACLDGMTDPIGRDALFRLLIDCVQTEPALRSYIRKILSSAVVQYPDTGPDYLVSWVRDL